MENLDIPTGYTHRSVLIGRGWTAKQINDLLTDVVKVDAPQGVSNKAYADAEIAQVESTNKAIAALADRVPATGPYTEANTISRSALVARGWTPAHINRLLGDPDAFGAGLRGESFRYGLDRVEWAEMNDQKLIRRLDSVDAKKAATLTAKVEVEGEIIFRNLDGAWHLEGMDLTEGEQVTVTKKDGSTTTAYVGKIVSDVEGRRIATVGKKPVAKPAPAPRETVSSFDDWGPAPRTNANGCSDEVCYCYGMERWEPCENLSRRRYRY